MRIDSRLMKTDMELASIERQDDRLLMKSPPGDWNATKVYLSPQDVVNTVRLSLNRGMIGYVLLFPFFWAAHHLRHEKDVSPFVYDIGYIVAALFMGLLLLGGTTFLLAEPRTGTIVLAVLALLFLFSVIGSGKAGFLYLAVPLLVICDFLLADGQGIAVHDFPKLALGVVLTLLILGRALGKERQGRLASPLYRTAYLVVLVFTGYIALNAGTYADHDPWGASLPLLAFALFHFVRYLDSREVLQQYAAMVLLGAGFLLGLYGLPFLPLAYFGLPLIALSMAMILVADRYHEAHGLAHVAPAYSVAIVIALLAFLYAWQDLSALLLALALLSVHFFGGTRSLGVKTTAAEWGERVFSWIEFALANLAAGLAALLMLTIGRANWASVVAAIVYVYFYRLMGFGREPTILKTRNQYLWAAGAFYGLLIFVVLGLSDPFLGAQNDMLLVPLLLLPMLIYGYVIQRRGQAGPAASVYESSLPTVVAALVLPVVLGNAWLPTAMAVSILFVILYGLLAIFWRNEALLYPLPILLANLYDNSLTAAGVSGPAVGVLFLPLGLLSLVAALWLLRRGAGPARTFFLAWFVFSAGSVLGAAADPTLTVYLVAGWAAAYGLAATFVGQSETRRPSVEAEGHV